jgi:hypothetical protein
MNQGIGVEHLESRAEFLDAGGQGAGDHASCFHAEHGAQALSSGEYAVPHGLVDRNRVFVFERDQAVEGGIGQPLTLFHRFFQHEEAV